MAWGVARPVRVCGLAVGKAELPQPLSPLFYHASPAAAGQGNATRHERCEGRATTMRR